MEVDSVLSECKMREFESGRNRRLARLGVRRRLASGGGNLIRRHFLLRSREVEFAHARTCDDRSLSSSASRLNYKTHSSRPYSD